MNIADAVELAPGRLFVLGALTPLDGRLSWAPKVDGAYQGINCYLLLEGSRALLIDSGVAAHRDVVLTQLGRLVKPGGRLDLFLTRAEQDCVSNLPAIKRLYETKVVTGGIMNPFDGYDDANALPLRGASEAQGSPAMPAAMADHRVPRTFGIDLGQGRIVRIIVPTLRTLPTYWPFDSVTGALFTSDMFTHTSQQSASSVEVLDDPDRNQVDSRQVQDHLHTRFWWLPGARTSSFISDLRRLFDEVEPTMIAPGHGCVIRGKPLVQQHLAALVAALRASQTMPLT